MVGLLVAMTVMAIMLGAALPAWHTMAQREKETELIFRGEQYARAIGLYQRRFANAAPPSIDVLVEQKYLRKKYKDPITNDDFQPLTVGGGLPGQVDQLQGRGQQPQGGLTQPAGRAGGAQATQGRGGAVVGGIMGVTSKSPLKSLRLYNGRDTYNQWIFVPVARGRVGQAGAGAGAAGGRGGDDGRGGRAGRGGDDGRGGRGGPSRIEELFQRGRGAGPADGRGGRGDTTPRGGR
jgi:type II secretory pathway pseudopilin PulG